MFAMFVFGGVKTAFADPIYSFTTFNAPGATGFGTEAYGINNSGQIVGFFFDAGNTTTHGFLDTGGSFINIDVPRATSTAAYGINASGQIVGYFADALGSHGFLDTGGSFTTINVPGFCCTSAQGINDHGQIVGWVGFPASPEMAFVATPVATPEPASLLTLAGIALLGIAWQHKRADAGRPPA
jgi:probable HAF family extracellular repeat protein